MSNPPLPPGQTAPEYPTFNAQVPAEGPKVVAVQADFSAASAYDLNTLLTQASGQQRSIAGVFVDNSANSEQLNITVSVINQVVKCPANAQLWASLFVPKNATVTISDPSASSTAKVPLMFTNFPVANCVVTGLS